MRRLAVILAASVALAGTAAASIADAKSAKSAGSRTAAKAGSVAAAAPARALPLRKASVARSAPTKKSVVVRPAPVKPVAAAPTAAPVAAGPSKATPARSTAAKPAVRATRYGGFMMAPPSAPLPPPVLDTTSPRALSLVNVNTGEALAVTYWSDGSYKRDALDKLNAFLRDSHENQQTEMDPLLYDVLWHTSNVIGFSGTIEVFSAFRSATTNAWLASTQRGVASDSQHINGNAMDVRFPGMPVLRIREAARSLNMGGVGFYPRAGFVHLDTGPVRYW